MHSSLLSLLAVSTLALAAPNTEGQLQKKDGALSGTQCCDGLKQILNPSQVLAPDNEEYIDQQSTYYSGEQAAQRPACRVTPATAQDVSLIVKYATQNKCEFAVRSGGHMSWVGSSNIGSNGFTIDLEELKEIELQDGSKTVSFQSGLRWADVYGFLIPHHLHTAGGRSSAVGTGGFLLGGGVSFLSLEHGFGSDNVINYEVVLADGTIANANQAENSDLYWALKGGSTNFGIVTRFDMVTFELDQLWGGSLFFNASLIPQLFEYIVGFTERLAVDPQGLCAFSVAWSPDLGDYSVWNPNAYLKPEAFPSPLFDGLRDFPPVTDTMRITNLVDVTDEIARSSPSGSRQQWFATVFKSEAQFPLDMFHHGQELFKTHITRPGASWALTIQPINVGMIAAAANRGGNPFGLTVDDGDLLLVLINVVWTNPANDDEVKANTQSFIKWARETAADRGILNRFIYMNYALNTQDVIGSFGEESVRRLREVKAKYDPENLLDLWKGGWKL